MSRKKKKRQTAPPAAPVLSRYDEWLAFFFGRLRDDDDLWELEWGFAAPAEEITDLFTFMLENAGLHLAPFSDHQLALGLNALFMPHHTDIPFILSDKNINDQKKDRLARALKPFYTDCLSTRCAPFTSQFDKGQDHPLGFFIYMVWDVSPLAHRLIGVRAGKNGNSALIETFGEILLHTPANPACLESILHGLGHLACSYPTHKKHIVQVIDRFLSSRPITRPELAQYADYAKQGLVQ